MSSRCSCRWLMVVIILALFLILIPHSIAETVSGLLRAHFIDVGQGDSCWLHFPNGDDVLVDGGKPQAAPRLSLISRPTASPTWSSWSLRTAIPTTSAGCWTCYDLCP